MLFFASHSKPPKSLNLYLFRLGNAEWDFCFIFNVYRKVKVYNYSFCFFFLFLNVIFRSPYCLIQATFIQISSECNSNNCLSLVPAVS